MEKIAFARHLRRKQTSAEELFWCEVRNRRFRNLKFKRQVPFNKYFADFLCESEKLVVEIDDPTHEDKVEYDTERTNKFNDAGYRVIRFTNGDIFDDMDAVLEQLLRFIGQE